MAGRGGPWSGGGDSAGHAGRSGGLRRGGWRVKRGTPSGALRCLVRTPPYCRSVVARAISHNSDTGAKGLTGHRYRIKQDRQERAPQRTLVAGD